MRNAWSARLMACVIAMSSALPAAAAPLALSSVVLLDRPDEVLRDGWRNAAPGIDASRTQALDSEAGRAVIAPFLGRPIDQALIGEIREAVQAWYKSIRHPFVAVTIPAQDATNGTLQVVVVEARLGTVRVEGNTWFDAGQYSKALHARPGAAIDTAQLDADIDWINRSPYRHATVAASRGTAVGITDLTVRTQEDFPISVTAGLDNTGTRATSLYRLNSGFDWGNAFWRGDDLNFRLTTSPDFYLLRQYTLSYLTDLPWRDTFSIQGSVSTSHTLSNGAPTNSTGLTVIISPRYTINLPSPPWLTHHVVLGYDFKSTNNTLLFGGTSVFDTISEVDQFLLGYGGQAPDRLGSTSLQLDLFGSPGGLTPLNNDAAFSAQQPGATARYVYARATVERLTNLPAGFTWDVRATLQLSNATLLSSEQMVFGGFASVRGFLEQGATRDNGVLIENELRLPPIHTGLPQLFGAKSVNDQLVPFVFFDYGAGWNRKEFPGPNSWLQLSSIGPGVT